MLDKRKRYLTTFGFIDLLFNMLVGFVFLFFIAYILINPIADDGKVDPPDQAMIVVNWSDNSKLDVDIWIKDPTGKILSFTNKTIPGMHLEKDDLGFTNDSLNGQLIYAKNQEVVHITNLLEGTYQVTLHLYSDHGDKLPQEVTVELMTIKKFRKLGSKTITLSTKGQEKPIVSFWGTEFQDIKNVDWNYEGTIVEYGKVNSIRSGEHQSLRSRCS